MALTTSQKMALFLLLSSRSQFRFDLERRAGGPGGTANPFTTAGDFAAALKTGIKNLNMGVSQTDLDAIDGNSDIASLWVGPRHIAGVPDRHIANLTTDHNEMVVALDLSLYTEDNPCPDTPNQVAIAGAVAALHLP